MSLLIAHQRESRIKAKKVAEAELLHLLQDFKPRLLSGGPFGEKSGIFWIEIHSPEHPDQLRTALNRLGYSKLIELFVPIPEEDWRKKDPRLVRWKKKPYRLETIYNEENAELLQYAPDQRFFRIKDQNGEVSAIKGYRGDGNPLSRRGLPVCDARVLVNLVINKNTRKLLDPFGGVGGILLEAAAKGIQTTSIDIDPFLEIGLAEISDHHIVGNAASIPLEDCSIDAVATEPPYHDSALEDILLSISEIFRLLKPGGQLSMLCGERQVEDLKRKSEQVGFETIIDYPINRKGTACHLFLWKK